MNIISKRQRDILLLLASAKEPLTSEWMAKELGISDRTVRTEIKLIQQEYMLNEDAIESTRGKGYQLKVQDINFFVNHLKQIHNPSDLAEDFVHQQNRVLYMLRRLILEKDCIKLDSFTEEMFVSLSTVQNDLKFVREILEKYNLKLTNRPYYGTKVEGDEYMKRLCLSNTLFSNNRHIDLYGGTMYLFDPELIQKIKQILIAKVSEYKIDISDISLENLATHIAIACKRIEEKFVIEPFEDGLIEHYPFERIVASEIIQEVEVYTGLDFPAAEIDYIIVHLLGTKLLHQKELIEYGEFDEVGRIVQNILERLQQELNWNLKGDMEFIQSLTLHIRPAMNRLRYKMNIRNPLLEDIKKKYPMAFEGAVIASKCIEEYLGSEVTEHEIAYIALHIGVALERRKATKNNKKRVLIICASGVGSAKLLYYRLLHLFENNIEIIDTINYYNLMNVDLAMVDLIISTIPIKEHVPIPVIVVSTFLEDRDIESIQKSIVAHPSETKVYTHASRIFLKKDLLDKESVIRFLCNELYRQQLVSKDYVELVLEREAIAPTSYGNLVAIPHPMKPVTTETFWTICTLKRPIQWHEQKMVQFVCLLNVKQGSTTDLDNMFKKLIAIIENKSTIQKLLDSQTPEEIIALLQT
ncbi:BglG family transcription antiterminator [Lysinibacillus piscis]|uniref:LicABCH operon regulator n=1 Tax=Lysinibacillus piscis TaxID=2518931 RepID=A0ABQ5NMK0_9BACI|nr:BglG family transcription antiterminator [Lysinibacillus sp. KH24]GLC89559.1 putative licABCH operon regulator [Lysinibacillus sp. KH24]